MHRSFHTTNAKYGRIRPRQPCHPYFTTGRRTWGHEKRGLTLYAILYLLRRLWTSSMDKDAAFLVKSSTLSV
ncbi:MAG: hypothetical protein WCQ66_06795, partial [Sphaerochaetaceae bacterium]